ncbi:hypothetical protein AVEN_158708-1, partial [Araneus ventricosus]
TSKRHSRQQSESCCSLCFDDRLLQSPFTRLFHCQQVSPIDVGFCLRVTEYGFVAAKMSVTSTSRFTSITLDARVHQLYSYSIWFQRPVSLVVYGQEWIVFDFTLSGPCDRPHLLAFETFNLTIVNPSEV